MGFDYRDLRQPTLARQSFETAVALAPHRTRAMVGLGVMAEEAGNWDEAVRQYSRAASVHPTDVTNFLLARALRHQGREAEAVKAAAAIADPAAAKKTADTFFTQK